MADGEAAQTAPDTAAAPAPERPSLRGCLGNGTWDETLKHTFLTKDDESTMRQSGLEVLFFSFRGIQNYRFDMT